MMETILAASSDLYRQGQTLAAMGGWLLPVKSAATFAALVILSAGEYFFPSVPVPRTGRLARWGRNLGLWVLNIPLSLYVVLPVTGLAAYWAPDWRPAFLQGGVGVLLDLILLDLFIYFWHRANHEVGFFWRFHRVHHYDRQLDISTALRFHFGEVFLSALVRGSFVFALGIDFHSIVVYEGLLLIAALFQHSNIRLNEKLERRLSWIIVTPSIHWVHHHARRADTDSNYASVLSVWDRLFGTKSPTPRTPAMTIGVEGITQDQALTRLMLNPFGRGN